MTKSLIRAGHGDGAGLPRVEQLPLDECPVADGLAAQAEPLATGRDPKGRVRTREAAAALAKLPRRPRGHRTITTDPRFEFHNRARQAWQRTRATELRQMTGGTSASVLAMLGRAAWLYAFADCAAEQAAASMDLDVAKTAANLASQAKQLDLAAYQLAVLEQQSRPRHAVDFLE